MKLTTGHHYGSIDVRDDADDEVFVDELQTKKKQLPLMIGSAALLLCALMAVFLRPGSNEAGYQSVLTADDVEILGKVHRSPEDTPHEFSQKLDHFDPHNHATWQQRYYRKSEYFKGPGHPIFLVVGGEGALDNGMFYPFVDTYLAEKFGAYVLHPEHRFYGQSQPIDPLMLKNSHLKKYHTAKQSIWDHLAIVIDYQEKLGCSKDKKSKKYCPVISVGGSYPGFLSAIMRTHYPEHVDIGYASSAPLLLYGMEQSQWVYMEKVTNVTDIASPGCADAVRTTLAEVDEAIRASDDPIEFAENELNICPGSLPHYIKSNDMLSKEAMMIVEYTFADYNMFYFPPQEDRDLAQVCKSVFQNDTLDSPLAKMREFWWWVESGYDPTNVCFDMSSQLPDGKHPRISGSDWSGIGQGFDGFSFDFHCCSTLTPAVGFSHQSMFPYREWTLEWLTDHCLDRFDVIPDTGKLVKEFKFDDLVGAGASRILFTNGMHDIWSEGSYLESLSDSIIAINIEDGAHHSDLGNIGGTKALEEAQVEIEMILAEWLHEVNSKMTDYEAFSMPFHD